MVKTQNIDTPLLDKYISSSGYKVGFLCDTLGISRNAFDKKRRGINAFRASEVYVLCDLLKITDDTEKNKIFYSKC